MSFSLGNVIVVLMNFIKFNLVVFVYNGEEIYVVIYYIEIGYNNGVLFDIK